MPGPRRIQVVCRLVDEQHGRVHQQCPGKREPLLHPVRVRPDRRPGVRETDRLQQARATRDARRREQAGARRNQVLEP